MEVRQRGFEPIVNNQPKNFQYGLRVGKVIRVDQGQKTVDVSMMDGSGIYHDVPVLSSLATTASGISHLPQMNLPDSERSAPEAFSKRDIYAIIGFVNSTGTMPIVVGFKHPEINQLSFPYKEGFENQHIERHEGDQYRRVVGDSVSDLGGEDVLSEEEIRYPDNSYFKAYGSNKALTNISQENDDAESMPFKVKKEERKGFYFQHSSGTKVLIDPDGQIKISHHTGTWISISPDEADLVVETVELETVDSATNPPTAAAADPVKIHIEHSSGTKMTIQTDGQIDVVCVADINVTSDNDINVDAANDVNVTVGNNATVEVAANAEVTVGGDATVEAGGQINVTAGTGVNIDGGAGGPQGVVQGQCICPFTGSPHLMVSALVKSSL